MQTFSDSFKNKANRAIRAVEGAQKLADIGGDEFISENLLSNARCLLLELIDDLSLIDGTEKRKQDKLWAQVQAIRSAK